MKKLAIIFGPAMATLFFCVVWLGVYLIEYTFGGSQILNEGIWYAPIISICICILVVLGDKMKKLAIIFLLLFSGQLFAQSGDLYALRDKLIQEGKVIQTDGETKDYKPLPLEYDDKGNILVPT